MLNICQYLCVIIIILSDFFMLVYYIIACNECRHYKPSHNALLWTPIVGFQRNVGSEVRNVGLIAAEPSYPPYSDVFLNRLPSYEFVDLNIKFPKWFSGGSAAEKGGVGQSGQHA